MHLRPFLCPFSQKLVLQMSFSVNLLEPILCRQTCQGHTLKMIVSTLLISSFSTLAFKGQSVLQSQYLQKSTELYSQELKITDQKVARKIYRWMPGEARQVSGVYGTWYKHHEFLFCTRNAEAITTCSIFFSSKANGTLSSFYKDRDYGMGDTIEASYSKPLLFNSDLYLYDEKLEIRFNHHSAVEKILQKIDLAEQIENKGVNYTSETYRGKHVSCTTYNSESGQYLECFISIPLPREKEDKTSLPNT